MGLELVSTTTGRTATNQTMRLEIGECTGDGGLGPKLKRGRARAKYTRWVDVPMPQRTDAARAILTAMRCDAGCLASVEKRGRSRWRCCRILCRLDSRQAAAKRADRDRRARTPRSAVRPRMGSFSQTACPYNVSALPPLARGSTMLLLGGTARVCSNGGTRTGFATKRATII